MELIVTGSGTAALESARGPSGYLLRTGEQICLLDGGTGTLLKCLQAGVSYKNIDNLFYTHLHPDHTIDLIPFLFATKNTPGFTRTRKLEIAGPVGFQSFFDRVVDLYGRSMLEASYPIEIIELGETELQREAFKVNTRFMAHAANAIGYRFEAEGKVLVYSGDTDYCDGIIELAREADVLLLECSFADEEKVSNHLTPTEAGKIASLANVSRLILTHIYPPFDAAEILNCTRSQFRGEVVIAHDLLRIQI